MAEAADRVRRSGSIWPATVEPAVEPAADRPVTIEMAASGDALIVAALTLQCALHRGGAREPGFLERFAQSWAADPGAHPCWLAEEGGHHAGYLLGALLLPLPWPGDGVGPGGGSLLVEQFFVRPDFRGERVGEHLLASARDWARAEGLATMQMRPGPHTRSLCERVGLVNAGDLMELRLEAGR